MKIYSFTDGHTVTSKLNTAELLKRMNRLDCLRVLTEGYESGEGHTIFQKVWRAYNKADNFTGIIRLTMIEKDFLGYMLESDMLSEEDRKAIEYYI